MLRSLLDADVCIRVLPQRPPSLRARFNEDAETLCLSDVVLYELLYGAERSSDPQRIRCEVEHFASRLAILPFDSEAAGHTADIRADLENGAA